MRKLLISLITTVIFFTSINTAIGAEFNYGRSWSNLSSEGRVMWVHGFATGQAYFGEQKNPSYSEAIISPLEADAIAKIMTQYYNDGANTYIPWELMTLIAKMKLKGESAKKIEEELELLRKYATEQRQK